MMKILHTLLHHSELYSETDEEGEIVDRMASEGLIYYVNLENQSGWCITRKGIHAYQDSPRRRGGCQQDLSLSEQGEMK